MAVTRTGRRLDELRIELAQAEGEYMAAQFIESTDRMIRERNYWLGRIEAIKASISELGGLSK